MKRRAIYMRDDNRCCYCGREAGDADGEYVELTLDHITPLAHGGDHSPTNLLTACQTCNKRRKDMDFREFVGCSQRAKQLRAQARRQLEPYLLEVTIAQRVDLRIKELVEEGRLQWVVAARDDDDIPF